MAGSPALSNASAGVLLYFVDAALEPDGLDPLGVELSSSVCGVLVNVSRVSIIVGIIGAAASVALRLWRARGQERPKIKWLVYATSVVVVGALGAVLFPLPTGDVFHGLMIYGFAGMPVAVGIAILRYRLYDIDLLINRTLVYGLLTATVVLVYFGSVAATQAIFRTLTTQEQLPQLVFVTSTLVIAAVFNPLRRRIQSFIDRSFYRRKYDATKTLDAFSSKLRDGPGGVEGRSRGGGEGDGAARARRLVVASSHAPHKPGIRLAAPNSRPTEKESVLRVFLVCVVPSVARAAEAAGRKRR